MVRKRSLAVERGVRRRARFQCQAENHKNISLNQYAHIIPHADGGEMSIENILWLCESCQRKYEAAGKSSLVKEATIKRLKTMRDRPVADSLVEGMFDELLTLDGTPIMIVCGSVGLQSLDYVFSEPLDSYKPAYLKFYRDGNTLKIEGHLKDRNGFTLIEFDGHMFRFHTGDAWDFERHPKYLKIINKSKDIWIELKQTRDLAVEVTGKIYAGGGIYDISKQKGIEFPNNFRISDLSFVGIEGLGQSLVLLPESPTPRPYGHINPNVLT